MTPESPTQPSSAAEALETIKQAFERVTANFRLAVQQKPVRDMDETLAEVESALALLPTLSAALAKEPVSLAKCKWALSKVFVPDGVWNIEEGMKMEAAAKAVLDTARVPYTEAALAGGEKGE